MNDDKKMEYTDEHGRTYVLTFSEFKMLEEAKKISERTNDLLYKTKTVSERTNDLLYKTKTVVKIVSVLLIIVIVAVAVLYFKLDSMDFLKICYAALT